VALGAPRLEQLCAPLNVSWWYVDVGLWAEHGHQRQNAGPATTAKVEALEPIRPSLSSLRITFR
jgi:hypothetical protein